MVKRTAFTMVELVMVIVVLGIVASIGADIISNLYTNYLYTRTTNRLQSQTEITLEQIAKRLQYRIKDSTIARKNSTTYISLPRVTAAQGDYGILEWIGYSNESLRGEDLTPGWSGFIDLDSNNTDSGAKTLFTPGSNLNIADTLIKALTFGNVGLAGAAKTPALIFKGKSGFDIDEYGWNGVAGDYTIRVSMGNNETFSINETTMPNDIYEHYYLSHTAYAIVPTAAINHPTLDDFNLTLHYNYQPWHNEKYDNANTSTAVLAQNVSLFRFRQDGDVVRLKLCLHDNNATGVGDFIVACKERVIY